MVRQIVYTGILGILVLCGLILAQSYSFLLFHCLAEGFSIVIACGIFMLAWNARRFMESNYLLFTGIAYLFIGGLDLVHTLVYKGMGVFHGYDANPSTQLWIAARYTESISLALAPLFIKRKLDANWVFWVYAAIFTLLLASIFQSRIFPDCFIKDLGLTPFKIISEYIITLILLTALAFLFIRRHYFDTGVLCLLTLSIVLTIASEISFTFYVSVYGLSNQIGHYLKIASFFLIYKAIIQTGLVRPYGLLFRELEQSREKLRVDHDQLDQRVQERTAELFAATKQLQKEIIERECAQKELLKVNRMLKTLSECNQCLVRATEEKTFLTTMCQNIIEYGGYRFAWVGLAEQNQGQSLRPVAQAGYEAGFLEEVKIAGTKNDAFDTTVGTVFQTGQPKVFRDIQADSDLKAWRMSAVKRGYASSIILPLNDNGDILGALMIYSDQPDAFSSQQVELLKELAIDAAFGITTLRVRNRRKAVEGERLLLANAIEQADECIAIADPSGTIEYINSAVERITGLKPRTYIGRSIGDLFDGNRTMPVGTILHNVQTGKSWRGQIKGKTKAGAVLDLNVALSPIRDASQKIDHFVGIIRDITRECQMEQQLIQSQKMEAIGSLAGGIAHDFNNILSAIIGFAQLAMDDVEYDSMIQNNLQEVLNAAHRAKELVFQILTFSREHEQEQKPINVKHIAKEVLKLIRASLPATIEIRSCLQSNSPVNADPTQIHQVLVNLCTNAAHAMQEKGGTLMIEISDTKLDSGFTNRHPDIMPGSYLKLTVSDTGCGMPANILERIFDPFFTTKPNGEGTGMGLSVVHGIIKSHGGVITVSSEPGKGTAINIFLPVIETEIGPEKTQQEPIPTGTERILFIDDDRIVQKMGYRLLKSLGYQVTTRTSSIEALELFKAQPGQFDLVITDMTMPEMTGDKMAEKMMRIRADIPIILCTGFSAQIDENKAMAMGIRAFVLKPIVKSQLAQKIRIVLDQPEKR